MTTTDPTASMGGPLSEAELIEMVGRRSLDEIRTYLAGPPALIGPGHGRDLDRMAWLLDRVDRLEGQLATTQAEVVIRDGAIVGRDKAIDSLEAWRRNWKPLVDAHMKRCSGCDACDSEDGDDA